jgi:hypothetical protein
MKYSNRQYPLFSACGLNCGLCPQYKNYNNGKFKCPGCAGEGFSEAHPACGVLSCSQKKGVEYCCYCDEYPCKKYDGADLTDSFITHKNQFKDFDKLKAIGIDAYKAEMDEKMDILEILLSNYNDGRRKSFFCVAVNLLDLCDIKTVMNRIAAEIKPDWTLKEKAAAAARLFNEMADINVVSLKLRKNVAS